MNNKTNYTYDLTGAWHVKATSSFNSWVLDGERSRTHTIGQFIRCIDGGYPTYFADK